MGEIIRTWLQSRLGVIIDLTPDVFGHYSKDGTLLARLLYNYDIINDTQLDTIIQTQDSALARVNLKHLRAWLKFIGVDLDDDNIEDISNGKGTSSLQVFYKLFLSLEMKDRLHFITLQKERERYIPTSAKFDVTIISEKPPPAELSDHPLSAPLVMTADVIEWHRTKFLNLIDRYKHSEEQFQVSKEHLNDAPIAEEFKNLKSLQRERILQENMDLDEFTQNHLFTNVELNDEQVDTDPHAAKKYIKNLLHQKTRKIAAEDSKNHTQQNVLSSVWGKIENHQERQLNEMIAKKVLNESLYEKQMLKKLCEIRRDKDRMSGNRSLVEDLMQKAKENSLRVDDERRRDELRRDTNRIEDESRRLAELDRRLGDKMLEKTEEYLHQLGRQVMNDLTNIALDSADYRLRNGQAIPRKVWNQWTALFIQGLSALDPEEMLKPIERLRGEGGEVFAASPELIKREELLDKRDLEDYLHLNGPWTEFIPEVDEEFQCFLNLGSKILGYIVHKLLAVIHPSPLNIFPPLPDYQIRAALLGLPDPSLHHFLQELLGCERIATVQVNETINFCLQKYKQEIREFQFVNLELNEQNDRNNLPRTSDIEKIDGRITDKDTQTPKLIPYEDMHPLLSDAAFIGKCVYKLLTYGKRIPEQLIGKALVAYLRSLRDIHGWVIIDYPSTYQQTINLEFVLSGKHSLNDDSFDSIDMTEETDHNEELDVHFECSRLVTNPLVGESDSKVHSHLTSFIRMKATEDNSGDENDVDQFYIDQGLALVFRYTSWNFETVEQLCRLIIENGKGRTEVSGIADITKQLGKSSYSLESFESSHTIFKSVEELQPGEPGWIYANVPQNKIILEELALCWISLESSYINGLTEILSLKRFTFLAVLPYKDFIVKYMFEFAAQPDNRQELLREFQKAFNDIPEDMRSDVEVKYELHCRIKDFQIQLWEICDQKRRESRNRRESIVRDHWTTGQMVILINIYLALMQIELNRFIDTVSIIEGYYLLITQESIQANRIVKPILQRVSFLAEDSIEKHKEILDPKEHTKSPPSSLNKSDLQNEIENILLDKNQEFFELTNTNAFRTIKANIDYCQWFVDDVLSSASEMLKKNDKKSNETPEKPRKNSKRKLSKRSSKLQTKKDDKKNDVADDAKLDSALREWRYALMYEVTRMETLLQVLESAWESDVEFLLTTIQHGLYLIDEKINAIYANELTSIKQMARIFCLAIEHHRSISGEMIFDGDRFWINSDPLMDQDSFRLFNSFPAEESDYFKFRMVQLGRLKDIFKRVAPSGIIAQRSFIYILQDLIACGEEDNKEPLVPPSWLKLVPPDVFELVHEIFRNTLYIDWREFLIYGMDIEHPTQDQLLDTLEHFRKKDEALYGILPKSVFFKIPMWFHENLINPSINSWLHEDFEYDEYESSNRSRNYDSSKGNSMHMRPKKKSISFRTDSIERKQLGIDQVTSEDVKLNLAKELLCEIFLENKEDVNYLKLLLSFCKDEDPRNGLAKALSVTLNCKICANFAEGEKFVQESLKMEKDYSVCREKVLKEAAQLVNQLIDQIFDAPENLMSLNAENVSLTNNEIQVLKSGRLSIQILDRPGELVDPASLLQIDSDKSSMASVTDSQISSIKESDNSSISQRTNSENLSQRDQMTREQQYWIPIAVFDNFFTDLVPNVSEQVSVLSPDKSLSENLRTIYDETMCQDLDNSSEMVLAHRVISHEFISLLLNKITKFTWKNMAKAVGIIIHRKDNKENILRRK